MGHLSHLFGGGEKPEKIKPIYANQLTPGLFHPNHLYVRGIQANHEVAGNQWFQKLKPSKTIDLNPGYSANGIHWNTHASPRQVVSGYSWFMMLHGGATVGVSLPDLTSAAATLRPPAVVEPAVQRRSSGAPAPPLHPHSKSPSPQLNIV